MTHHVSPPQLDEFAQQALIASGAAPAQAAITAELLVKTDTWGVYSHGTKLLGGYCRRLHAGGLRGDGAPQITRSGPAWAVVDGHSLMGQVTSQFAMQTAIDLASNAGIAYVGVRNSCHFGAAGVYAAMAADAGLIGMAMANDIPSVVAPGARQAVVGTNPLAYAIPTRQSPPILLDISMATVAGGKVYAACQRGEPIAPDWLIGDDGKPTTDGSLYPAQAALAPMTGHKGYGLALLIESLSGLLSGAAVTWNVGSWMHDDGTQPTDHGAAFVAVDPAIIAGPAFLDRVEQLIAEIHATPTAEGVSQVYLPGEQEWTRRERALREGIPFPPDVREALDEVAVTWGVSKLP